VGSESIEKSLIGVAATTEFSTALGQFLKYQMALEEEQPERGWGEGHLDYLS
jgi:hypothetical protein